MKWIASVLVWVVSSVLPYAALPADRLLGVHSARVMSQSMPWIAEEARLFRKYDLEFPLVYIGSSPLATAAMLGGDGELLMDGGLGIVRAYVQGNTELVCIGGQKNIFRPEAFQAILDDVAPTDPRAKKVKPEDFIDRRFLNEMTKSGFFDKLWGEKS